MSKYLISYSSKTGNTAKVAATIACELGGLLIENKGNQNLNLAEYKLVCIGFWLDKGNADADSLGMINKLAEYKNVAIALFGTLGGDPESDRSKEFLKGLESAIQAQGNPFLGSFLCRGKIDPLIVVAMEKQFPAIKDDPKHLARIAAAATHPDDQDLIAAAEFAQQLLPKLINN